MNVSFIISYSCLCFCINSDVFFFLLVYLIHIDHDARGCPEGGEHSTDKQMSGQPRETLLKHWPLGLKSSVMFQPRPVFLSQKLCLHKTVIFLELSVVLLHKMRKILILLSVYCMPYSVLSIYVLVWLMPSLKQVRACL